MPEREGWISHTAEQDGNTFSAAISQRRHSETAERKVLLDVAPTPAFDANSLRGTRSFEPVTGSGLIPSPFLHCVLNRHGRAMRAAEI